MKLRIEELLSSDFEFYSKFSIKNVKLIEAEVGSFGSDNIELFGFPVFKNHIGIKNQKIFSFDIVINNEYLTALIDKLLFNFPNSLNFRTKKDIENKDGEVMEGNYTRWEIKTFEQNLKANFEKGKINEYEFISFKSPNKFAITIFPNRYKDSGFFSVSMISFEK